MAPAPVVDKVVVVEEQAAQVVQVVPAVYMVLILYPVLRQVLLTEVVVVVAPEQVLQLIQLKPVAMVPLAL
jgi:hypothetical protein